MTGRRRKRKTFSGVRVPLPRQIGGPHEDKTKRPARRRKHRERIDRDAD